TYIRPIPGFNLTLGFSTILDINPARDFMDVTNGGAVGPVPAGSPIFIYPGLDLDLPFVEGDAFGLTAFADGGLLLPYFRSSPSASLGGSVINPGFASSAIYDKTTSMPFKNWGIATGLLGNVVIHDLTWRLEFRDYTGSFTPQFYGPGYERHRTTLVYNVLTSLVDPNNPAYNTQNMGIFGEGGISLGRLFSFKVGYYWPWNDDVFGNLNDDFTVTFVFKKGVIPVANVWGSIAYERTNFLRSIKHGANLFDADTVVSTSINYSVTESLDL